MAQTQLSDAEKQQFFDDGFIVIRNAVPRNLALRAQKLLRDSLPEHTRRLLAPPQLATDPRVIGLFNDTCLPELMRNTLGPFPEVISCQIAVTPGHDKLGGVPGTHVDGSWGGEIPSRPEDIDLARGRPHNAERYFGANDDRRGTNDGQLWQDPQRRLSLGSYSAIVGVALNDQTVPGNGQFGVLRGLHREVEANFRRQRDAGSVVGPEGIGWPRIKVRDDGRPYLNGLFDSVEARAREMAKTNPPIAGWPWPELTPVCLDIGDAVIALHACPHTATPNLGPNARMNVYFRLRRWRDGNPHEGSRRLGHGVSDHLDRGYYGQFLEYPQTYDPWKTTIDLFCDHWKEWDGMRDVVAASAGRRASA